ncbi:MAG: alpha-glucosidase C-terminal domain-containing protein [Verrucomicrobiota bacterium]
MRVLESDNPHILSFLRWYQGHQLVIIANFSDAGQTIDLRRLRVEGFAHFFKDLLSGKTISTHGRLELAPYDLLWLKED